MTTRYRSTYALLIFFGCHAPEGEDSGFSTGQADSDTDGAEESADGTADSGLPDASSDSSADDSNGDSGETKFDLDPSDEDGGGSECGCGNDEWSYVWVAGGSTVSKINTRTLKEEGRYWTRPDGGGSPSRTSVSIDGKAVVVANRHTGLTKIWTRPELCEDQNGVPGIQTSTGPNDVLPWGQDDCVAWHTPFPGMTTQRPVAWTSGTLNEDTCEYEDQKIWTVTGANGNSPGRCDGGGIWIHLLDGVDGTIDETLHVPENVYDCWSLGPYGGAVTTEGGFWFHTFGGGKLFSVDLDSMTWDTRWGGGYGITTDTNGRVWFSHMARYDPDADTWDASDMQVGGNGGVAQDLQGRMWAANGDGVVWADMETMAVGDAIALPPAQNGASTVKGVSVDIDGYIWAIRQSDTRAFRIDPDSYEIEWVEGLTSPYTYSDMTGGQLSNVTCHAPEG